jgi:hypothetical protein
MIEIKYAKSGLKPGDTKINQLKEEAEKQLKTYGIDKKFKKNMEKTTLIQLVLVFSGHKAMHIGEIK